MEGLFHCHVIMDTEKRNLYLLEAVWGDDEVKNRAPREAPNNDFWRLRTGIPRVEKSEKRTLKNKCVCVCVCVCVGDVYLKDNYFRILPLAKTLCTTKSCSLCYTRIILSLI